MSTFKPKISVISTYKNADFFIKHFVQDILRQTFFRFSEFIFIEDIANDTTLEKELILSLKELYPDNIVFIKNTDYSEDQSGLYGCWNLGLHLARSDIVTNWNLDDRRFYNSLEKQYLNLVDSDKDVCYGYTITTYKPNERSEDCDEKFGFGCFDVNGTKDLLENNSPHCLPMWRKSIHEKIGYFDTRFKICSDYEMWLRLAKNNGKFLKINELIGTYYRNPNGLSSSNLNIQKALKEIDQIKAMYG
jgi:hypothetical protein